MTSRPDRKGVPISRGFERKMAQQGRERQMLAAADLAFGSSLERLQALYGLGASASKRVKYLSSRNLEIEDARRASYNGKACAAHLEDLRSAYGPDFRLPGRLTPE